MRDIVTGITDVDAYFTSSDPYPDVVAMDNFYGDAGPVAWVDCPANNTGVGIYYPTGSEYCRGQYLRWNGTLQDPVHHGASTRAIACHELGHTFGLRHYTSVQEENNNFSCMRTATRPLPETYSSTDRFYVNGAY